jgi:methyl-accepting chemotaxis protein
MSDQNGMLSIIANRKIGTKVATGFAAVLLILAVSSTLAYLSFGRTSGAVDEYARLVRNSVIFRNIDLKTTQYRGLAREYVFSGNEATADSAIKDADALSQLLADGLTKAIHPERHRLLEDAAKQAETFGATFRHVREMKVEQSKLQTGVLDVVGPQMTDAFTALINGGNKTDNPELQRSGDEGRRLALLARLNVDKLFGQHDAASAKSAEQTFTDLAPVLAQLDAASKDSELNATAKSVASLVERYHAAFRRAASLDDDQITAVNGSMTQAADALAADAAKAVESSVAQQAVIEADATSASGSGETLVMWFGVAGLGLGAVLAWLIGHGISRPVIGMVVAMRALANGDKAVEIPGVGRQDEIGQMAETVAVFKANMIETERLRVEQEMQKQRTADERRKTMLDLAARFEATAGSIVTGVTAQATELQATAQSMASIAEETSHQASTVAAASEQATQNVNTVAASTEELSASVREILQRVTESTHLTSETAREANAANTDIQALSSAMDRIGQVVGLINGIAGQTNLLALNATIEAARAGDAGKGFAVVASEVKALANQTAKATEEISTQIAAIQAATKGSADAIQRIVTRITKVSETATAIASAVEEQGAATAEIARNVAEAAKGTGEVTTNIVGVNTAAQQTGAAAGQMLAAASSLSQNSENLKTQVDAFLHEVRAA